MKNGFMGLLYFTSEKKFCSFHALLYENLKKRPNVKWKTCRTCLRSSDRSSFGTRNVKILDECLLLLRISRQAQILRPQASRYLGLDKTANLTLLVHAWRWGYCEAQSFAWHQVRRALPSSYSPMSGNGRFVFLLTFCRASCRTRSQFSAPRSLTSDTCY